MKRKYLFCFLAVLLVLTQILNSTAMVLADDTASEGDASNYESAVVIDISTGNILYEKNADKQIYPAGLMKLMTGLVAIEKTSSTETVKVSNNEFFAESPGSLDVVLHPGEEISVRDALFALFLKSGDDAALALAEHISGSATSFTDEMNKLSEEIGCTGSVWKGPNNYYGDGTLTTARDLAIIAKELYSHPLFRSIIEADTYTIPATNKSDPRELWQDNRMKYKANTDFYNPLHIGGKVGYSEVGGGCFLSFAENKGMTVACIVMGCKPSEEIYSSTSALYDKVFNQYTRVYPLRGYTFDVDIEESVIIDNYFDRVEHSLPYYYVNEDLAINVDAGYDPADIELNPVMYTKPAGSKAGVMEIYYKGSKAAETDIEINISSVYPEDYLKGDGSTATDADKDKDAADKKVRSVLMYMILIVIGLMIPLLVVLLFALRRSGGSKKK